MLEEKTQMLYPSTNVCLLGMRVLQSSSVIWGTFVANHPPDTGNCDRACSLRRSKNDTECFRQCICAQLCQICSYSSRFWRGFGTQHATRELSPQIPALFQLLGFRMVAISNWVPCVMMPQGPSQLFYRVWVNDWWYQFLFKYKTSNRGCLSGYLIWYTMPTTKWWTELWLGSHDPATTWVPPQLVWSLQGYHIKAYSRMRWDLFLHLPVMTLSSMWTKVALKRRWL